MSSEVFEVKTNARADWLFANLGMDLTAASGVTFSMRLRGGATKVSLAAAQIGNGTYIIDGVSTVLTPASGVVFYPWGATDLDTAGTYEVEFTPTFAAGKAPRPGGAFITVRILGAIA